jgi:NADH-quinone oxidoreductase subunit L
VGPILFQGLLSDAIHVDPARDVLRQLAEGYHGPVQFALHGFAAPAFWLALAGALVAWYVYLRDPSLAERAARGLGPVYGWLLNKYGFDDFNDKVFAAGGRRVGGLLWRVGDADLIDGVMVNGSARAVGWAASVARRLQSGYLYHYAFAMIIGLLALLSWLIVL